MRSRGVRTVSLYIYVELALLRLFRGIVFVVSRKENALFFKFFRKKICRKEKSVYLCSPFANTKDSSSE